MRIRKQALGDRNIVGAKIEQKRKSMGMKAAAMFRYNDLPISAQGQYQ